MFKSKSKQIYFYDKNKTLKHNMLAVCIHAYGDVRWYGLLYCQKCFVTSLLFLGDSHHFCFIFLSFHSLSLRMMGNDVSTYALRVSCLTIKLVCNRLFTWKGWTVIDYLGQKPFQQYIWLFCVWASKNLTNFHSLRQCWP